MIAGSCRIISMLKAQVVDQTGQAEAVRAINNLAVAPVQKDTPSLIDEKGLGRLQDFLLANMLRAACDQE